MPYKDPADALAYRLNNRERILAQQAASRARKREATRKKDAARREANREAIRTSDRAAYAANPEPKKAKSRARRAAKGDEINAQANERNAVNPLPNRQRAGAWQKANRKRKTARDKANRLLHPEKHRLRNARRRASKRGLPDTFTLEQEAFMLAYWQNACAVCGNQQGFFWTLVGDHWIPLSAADSPGTIATNIVPLCHGEGSCNNSKHKAQPAPWLITRYGPRKAATILKAITAYFTEVQRRFPSPAAAD